MIFQLRTGSYPEDINRFRSHTRNIIHPPLSSPFPGFYPTSFIFAVISGDNTMDDKIIYTPNNDKQNDYLVYFYHCLKSLNTFSLESTNQIK